MKHVKKKLRRRLKMLVFDLLAGKAFEDQSGYCGNVAKLATRHLGGVDARLYVFQKIIGTKYVGLDRFVDRYLLVRQQFEAVVVHCYRKSDRLYLGDTVCDQC